MARPDRRINLVVARTIPPVLIGAIIYACYAVTKPLCIDYLIRPLPKYNHRPRPGAGAAIIAVFYVLLISVLGTYLRLLYNVTWDPGCLPLAPRPPIPGQPGTEPSEHAHQHGHRKSKSSRRTRTTEKTDRTDVDMERGPEYVDAGGMIHPDMMGLEKFYTKDAFVCQPDGRPLYCSTCCQYKPDRAHHSRENERCIRKMDHFCPWVGGVVSETSFKFFIQFVFYTLVFCAFILIVCAIFTAELKRGTGDVNAHWAVGIGLSSFFGIFTFGMTLSSIQLTMLNLTTIENLSRRSVVWTLAIRVPDRMLSKLNPNSHWAPTFRTITYPLPAMPPPPIMPDTTIPPPGPETTNLQEAESTSAEAQAQPPPAPAPPIPAAPPQFPTSFPTTEKQHVFAVLQTLPGENPFDLGSPLKNLQQVLGNNVFDWFLPLRHSPCTNHESFESEFPFGPVVERLRREAGLDKVEKVETEPETESDKRESRHKRKKRRHHRRRE